MNLYQSLGYLVLGSRLRRISETFLSGIGRAYQQQGIEFEASWFPIFYLLAKYDQLSQRELSERIEVSYPAISQLVTLLKNKGLVKAEASPNDGRKQLISLTVKGKRLLEQVKPLWEAILITMDDIVSAVPDHETILPAIMALENVFQSSELADRISENLARQLKPANHD